MMRRGYRIFQRKIYEYCDDNQEQDILFPAFMNLWNGDFEISKKDLAIYASEIVSKLIQKGFVEELHNHSCEENVYGYYKINNYENRLIPLEKRDLKTQLMAKFG